MTAFLRPETCLNCKWKFMEKGETFCRFNPPSALMFMSPKGPLVASAYPKVENDWWCAKYEKGISVATVAETQVLAKKA